MTCWEMPILETPEAVIDNYSATGLSMTLFHPSLFIVVTMDLWCPKLRPMHM